MTPHHLARTSVPPVGTLTCALVLLIGCHGAVDGDGMPRDGEPGARPDGGGSQGSPDAAAGGPTIPFFCPGGTIAPGMNTFVVDGRSRTFIADFPTDMSKPLGVVFSWHGYMQTAQEFHGLANLDPNANPGVPLVVITPDDTDMIPPFGLGWDLVDAASNIDFLLFESVLACLRDQHTIDPRSIYSFGFSAGSVMTSLIHSNYPKLVSTIAAESGAWFNDPAQRALVAVPLNWQWPELVPADGGNVLLTHGGPNDVTVANIMSLENAARAAIPFLAAGDRIVADCAHDGGHVLDPHVTPTMIVSFLTAYRTGEPTNAQAGFGVLPATCALRLP